jgi:hypothetical protein
MRATRVAKVSVACAGRNPGHFDTLAVWAHFTDQFHSLTGKPFQSCKALVLDFVDLPFANKDVLGFVFHAFQGAVTVTHLALMLLNGIVFSATQTVAYPTRPAILRC